MSRLSNSWRLAKASAAVLRSDKELILFPIVSGIASLVVTATFFGPLWLSGALDGVNDQGNVGIGVYGVVFLFYLVQYFVIIYANAALVGAALIRLRGGDPTVSDGFRIASAHVVPILGYALISATVGMILQVIRERFEFVGQIVASLIGVAWSLVTFLAVPVLVVEGVGPVEAVKRSATLFKRTWGEQMIGTGGIGLVMFLIGLAAMVVCAPLVLLAFATESLALIVPAVALVVVVLTAIGLIGSALSGIYTAALYRYAADGEVANFFAADLIRGAFAPKGR